MGMIDLARQGPALEVPGVAPLEKNLAVDFPEYDTIPFGFMAINVPAGLSITTAAWYGLKRTTIRLNTSDELLLYAHYLDRKPPDTAGNGDPRVTAAAGGFLTWGKATNAPNAFVVMGKNLPITPGAWTDGPIVAPGLNSAAVATGEALLNTTNGPREMIVRSFPNGAYDTATKAETTESRAPAMKLFRDGDNFDVAIVAAPNEFNGLVAAKTLVGYLYGEAYFSKRFASVAQREA